LRIFECEDKNNHPTHYYDYIVSGLDSNVKSAVGGLVICDWQPDWQGDKKERESGIVIGRQNMGTEKSVHRRYFLSRKTDKLES
jgi:hypothetical protein